MCPPVSWRRFLPSSRSSLETCPPGDKPLNAPLTPFPGHQLHLGTFNPLSEANLMVFDGNRGCEPGVNRLAPCAGPVGIQGSLRPPDFCLCARGMRGSSVPLPCKGKETLSPV